jgi:hypothetical protein
VCQPARPARKQRTSTPRCIIPAFCMDPCRPSPPRCEIFASICSSCASPVPPLSGEIVPPPFRAIANDHLKGRAALRLSRRWLHQQAIPRWTIQHGGQQVLLRVPSRRPRCYHPSPTTSARREASVQISPEERAVRRQGPKKKTRALHVRPSLRHMAETGEHKQANAV